MNQVTGTISSIEIDGQLSLVSILAAQQELQALVIDTPISNPHLTIGNPIKALFKETEVVLAKPPLGHLSIENRIHGHIDSLQMNELLCKVILRTALGSLAAVVTKASAFSMELLEGDAVVALVKTNEIMLSE